MPANDKGTIFIAIPEDDPQRERLAELFKRQARQIVFLPTLYAASHDLSGASVLLVFKSVLARAEVDGRRFIQNLRPGEGSGGRTTVLFVNAYEPGTPEAELIELL